MYYMDRTTHEYPLSRWDLLDRNPDFVDPGYWDEAILERLNVYQVYAREPDTMPRYDQTCVEGTPQQIDGIWYQSWTVVELSPDDLRTVYDQEWATVHCAQEAILNQNVVITSTGNVTTEPRMLYEYTLPENSGNIIINGGNVILNGMLFGAIEVLVNDQLADLSVDQAIISDNIYVSNATIYVSNAASSNVEVLSGISQPIEDLIIHAAGNISVISPYPAEIPVILPEVEKSTYDAYLEAVRNATKISNPFDVTFPRSPLARSNANPNLNVNTNRVIKSERVLVHGSEPDLSGINIIDN